MKNKYIYILISIVCFFAFSVNVEADYKNICEYKKEYKYDDSDKTTIKYVSISYDSSNKKEPYKIVYKSLESDSNDRYDENKVLDMGFSDPNSEKLKSGFGWNVDSYGKISSNQCPKYVGINTVDKEMCFWDDTSSKVKCMKKYGTDPRYGASKMDIEISGVKVSGKTFNNLKDGQTCEPSTGLNGQKGESICYIRYTYDKDSNDLIIEYGTSKDKMTTLPNSAESFECGTVTNIYDGHGRTQTFKKTIYLVNTNANLFSSNVLVFDRYSFNQKFLEHWNNTGSCDNIVGIDINGDESLSDTNYWALFGDAYNDVKEHGSDKIDINGFQYFKDWNYDWNSWFGNKTEYKSCDGLLGDDLIGLINDILLYIRILVPVILIGLGITDFVKAVISVNDDAMVKARNKFLKRLIMAVVVFIIPSLVSLLLDTLNGIWAYLKDSSCSIWD